MAQDLAQAEVIAQHQVMNASSALARDKKYGYAPRENPLNLCA
jgi:hypothetical protein